MARLKPIKLVIAAGGTGGHVLPAVSVLEELNRRAVEIDVLWIGSRRGIERSAAKNAGVRFEAIATGKLRRYLDVHTIPDALRAPVGAIQSWRILRSFRPDVIFSTGGFVSVPTVAAGARIAPILTHEQTTIIGLATKLNSHFADVVALSYEATRARTAGMHSKIVVTGNPVRRSLLEGVASRGLERFGFSADLPLLYVTGGARGATPVNTRIEALLPELLKTCQVLHQAGPVSANQDAANLEKFRSELPVDLQLRYQVREFIGDEIADVYAAATLIVARAGAGTVAELALLGKPAILIPLPLSGGGEQVINARMLADAGAAVVMPQEEADSTRLLHQIQRMIGDPAMLAAMSISASSLGRPDAAKLLTDELLGLVSH